MTYKAKVINDMGKFIVIGDTIDLTNRYNMWLTNVGIYDLVNADLVPQHENGIRWFERKPGVPDNKSYNIRDDIWIHVDFSNILIAK
jgi:hypothetical protein